MRLRFRPVPWAAMILTVSLLDALRGLAGPASGAVAFFPLFLAAASLFHLFLSYLAFGFHQDFSSDHPAKGDKVEYALHADNGFPFPLAALRCRFSASVPGTEGFGDFRAFLGARGRASRRARFSCAYRGVYSVGVASFSFRDVLGLAELEERTEPWTFHVYPQLVDPGCGVEALASGGGDGEAAPGSGGSDPGVFDSLYPLRDGQGAARVAWKRYAAAGVPCAATEAGVEAYGLRVALDLRPYPRRESEEDRLRAEDLAVTAAYSALDRLSARGVPAELVLGGDEVGERIDDRVAFDRAYRASTSVLFTDRRFPAAAFRGDRATLLVSLRPVAEFAEGASAEPDLFEALEGARAKGFAVFLLTVPPPSRAELELERTAAAAERLGGDDRAPACRALDSRRGVEGVIDAFRF